MYGYTRCGKAIGQADRSELASMLTGASIGDPQGQRERELDPRQVDATTKTLHSSTRMSGRIAAVEDAARRGS